ncbi:MAG: hypothetical protein OXG97_13955 [Candidatus Poribacteria bacterium]|nr:hypothetical protein [Candidatus Poribacteria bacterium]
MIHIHFDALLRTEAFVERVETRLTDATRFWTDFLAPFIWDEIDDIFDSEGNGRWAGLDPLYAARKGVTHPGKGILEREGSYRDAATHPNRPGSIAEYSAQELALGVSGGYFESRFGANYPALHEEGNDETNLSARPVYELIAAGERFEERVGQLGDKYLQEEIAAAERGNR